LGRADGQAAAPPVAARDRVPERGRRLSGSAWRAVRPRPGIPHGADARPSLHPRQRSARRRRPAGGTHPARGTGRAGHRVAPTPRRPAPTASTPQALTPPSPPPTCRLVALSHKATRRGTATRVGLGCGSEPRGDPDAERGPFVALSHHHHHHHHHGSEGQRARNPAARPGHSWLRATNPAAPRTSGPRAANPDGRRPETLWLRAQTPAAARPGGRALRLASPALGCDAGGTCGVMRACTP